MSIDPAWVTGIGTGVLAVATITLAAVTGVYVRNTGEAVEASKRSAQAAEEAAAHARTAAEATERMAEAAERAEIVQAIPLVTAELARRAELPKGGAFRFRVDARNAGPGAAINVAVQLFDGQLPGPRRSIAASIPPGERVTGQAATPTANLENMSLQLRYQDRQGREYLAVRRSVGGWSYGHIRRPHGPGEFVDWLIEAPAEL